MIRLFYWQLSRQGPRLTWKQVGTWLRLESSTTSSNLCWMCSFIVKTLSCDIAMWNSGKKVAEGSGCGWFTPGHPWKPAFCLLSDLKINVVSDKARSGKWKWSLIRSIQTSHGKLGLPLIRKIYKCEICQNETRDDSIWTTHGKLLFFFKWMKE